MAVQPQIIKSYAAKRIDDSHSLVLQSSRLAFILMLALVTPIIFEADYILGLWLKSVPKYTVSLYVLFYFFISRIIFASFDTFDVSYRKY